MVLMEKMNLESVTDITQINVRIIIKMALQKMVVRKVMNVTTGMQPTFVAFLLTVMFAQG